jgi:type IV pilus assembly protein PilW
MSTKTPFQNFAFTPQWSHKSLPERQRGMTLVELMVAMVIGLVISLAAVTSLIVTRRGFTTVDAASQLRDNSRYASDLIQRIALQTGFKDVLYVTGVPNQKNISDDAAGSIAANVTGFNDANFNVSDLTSKGTGASTNGSDVLILRYQTSKLNNDANSSVADGSMIDCSGTKVTTVPVDRNDRMVSVFYVAVGSDGEPSLMCGRSNNGLAPYTGQPIIQGVETFQVLYGVDGYTSDSTAFTGTADSVPERYLRADQIVIGTAAGSTSTKATYDNWRRVRSIRIGMVLRGPANSGQQSTAPTLYPFGGAKSSSGGAAGSALSAATASDDPGTVFTPPADGRLRQAVTFTIHLRNDQGL